MSVEDKANNKIEELGGKLKEVVGKITGDESTENEGKLDQTKSNLKAAGEKIKDAFKARASALQITTLQTVAQIGKP